MNKQRVREKGDREIARERNKKTRVIQLFNATTIKTKPNPKTKNQNEI